MAAIVFVLVLTAAGAVSWAWGKYIDPKSEVVPCCHCGQCLTTGECTMRRRLKEKAAKR